MRPGPRRAQPRETGTVVGKEGVVRRREPAGGLVIVGVVGEPVHPGAAEAALDLPDAVGIEVRSLEDQYVVGGFALEAGGEPGDERASEDRVPAAPPFFAAAHLAAERRQRRRERGPAAVIAAV